MAVDHQSTWILGLQGWVVARKGVRLDGATLVLSVEHGPGHGYRCRRCGQGVLFAYDHLASRRIRDFPWAGRPCELEVTFARVECPTCRVIAVEAAEWVEPYARQTERYERYVAALCSLMPATDVADLEGLDKTTVYRIDKKWLARREARRADHPVARLGLDEIAIRKGQRYATVFYDLDRREVIGMVLKRKERAVSRFFRRWA
jgi:transposase